MIEILSLEALELIYKIGAKASRKSAPVRGIVSAHGRPVKACTFWKTA
jgi:hypothetical protein